MAAMTMLFPTVGPDREPAGRADPAGHRRQRLTVSCLMLVGLRASTPFSWLFASYVVFGIGFGFVNAPITTAAVSGMPRAQAGVAAGIASTSRQIGQTLGVAVVGSLVSGSLLGGKHVDFAVASQAGWWVLAGCGAAVLVLGLVATSGWAGRTAQERVRPSIPSFSRSMPHDRPMTKARRPAPGPMSPGGLAGRRRAGARQRAAAGGEREGRSQFREDPGPAADRPEADVDEGAGRAARGGTAQPDGGRRARAGRGWSNGRPTRATGGSSWWWPPPREAAGPGGRGDPRARTPAGLYGLAADELATLVALLEKVRDEKSSSALGPAAERAGDGGAPAPVWAASAVAGAACGVKVARRRSGWRLGRRGTARPPRPGRPGRRPRARSSRPWPGRLDRDLAALVGLELEEQVHDRRAAVDPERLPGESRRRRSWRRGRRGSGRPWPRPRPGPGGLARRPGSGRRRCPGRRDPTKGCRAR